ncbi:MAG: ABC transporter permease, partial [Rhodobacterales bacterium]
MSRPQYERAAWVVGITLILLFLYLPIAVLVAYSFNESRSLTWPMTGFTMQWYQKLADNSALIKAFYNSLYVAVCATTLTLMIGIPAAIALDRIDFPGKGLFRKLILLPIALPGIITGISMLILFR